MEEFNQHIILDVDNTLLYTANTKLKSSDKKESYDFMINLGSGKGFVYLRPDLKEFLEFCFNRYKTVSIWTLGNSFYLESILKGLRKELKLPLKFNIVYTYEDTPEKYYEDIGAVMNIKDLNKIWEDPKYKDLNIHKNNTIFIDDRSDVLRETPGNHIEVHKYIGQKKDETFTKLMQFLEKIGNKKMIPRVNKLNWFNKNVIKKSPAKRSPPKKSPKKIEGKKKNEDLKIKV